MVKILGSELSKQIQDRLKLLPVPNKSLVAFLIGHSQASASFLRQKKKVADELQINFLLKTLPENVTEEIVLNEVKKHSLNKNVGGILVQLPLSSNLDTQTIVDQIPAGKDVDVLSTSARAQRKILPPAVKTVEEILKTQRFLLENKTVAVVGLGRLVGQPVFLWMQDKVKNLIRIGQDDDLNQIKLADLIITGAGKPRLINPAHLKDHAAVIDFGYGKIDQQTSGDLDTSKPSFLEKLSFYTPTPNGTGPILTAKLLENFYLLNK
jgi:methylenetetrahydrofolate dehydrogenase (NADP+) / methenyltetrahydrofolate cyclohydrolase